MTFAALLTKELRLRLRRERTIWVLITYLLVMTLLGFLFISRTNIYNSNSVSTLGLGLYTLLVFVQLFLIMFITPAFTATSINGEKERQTFDLITVNFLGHPDNGVILASYIASWLMAGAFLAVGACISATTKNQVIAFVVTAALVFVVTAIVVGTFGLFCSTLLKRPPVSIAIAYMFCVIWVFTPWLLSFLLQLSAPFNGSAQGSYIFLGNPILAMISTFTFGVGPPIGTVSLFGTSLAPWITYTIINLLLTIVLLLLSTWLVKPYPISRLSRLMEKRPRKGKAAATV